MAASGHRQRHRAGGAHVINARISGALCARRALSISIGMGAASNQAHGVINAA